MPVMQLYKKAYISDTGRRLQWPLPQLFHVTDNNIYLHLIGFRDVLYLVPGSYLFLKW